MENAIKILEDHLNAKTQGWESVDLRFFSYVIKGLKRDLGKKASELDDVTIKKHIWDLYKKGQVMPEDYQPNWDMDLIEEVDPGTWLIHFTSLANAQKIVQNGFKIGCPLENVYCTTERTDHLKGKGPYAFAFLADSSAPYNFRRDPNLGSVADANAAVVFQNTAKALNVHHNGDNDFANQVIFDKSYTGMRSLLTWTKDSWTMHVGKKEETFSMLRHIDMVRQKLVSESMILHASLMLLHK